MDNTQMNISEMEYAKNSYQQDEKDSGYTEINMNFQSFNDNYPDSKINNNAEMDTEVEYLITEAERNYSQCDDDASDFYPSDPEDVPFKSMNVSMEEKRKKYQSRGLKIFKDLTENMSAPWKDELDGDNAFLSNMYKFNEEKKRWVKKGPVAIFILPKQFRLVTYNLYGQQTPALNIKLWEFMSKYSISNEKMILLNSFGRNFKNRVFINASVAYLKDMVDTTRLTDKEKDLIKNEKVNICSSTVMPCPENESSKIVFHFRLPEELERFKLAFNKICNDLYIHNCQERYATYITEQPIINSQGNPTGKCCQYPYSNTDLFIALSRLGFEYKPIEDETGKVLNDRVVCSFCGATYAGWFMDIGSIESVHRQHSNAISYKCPFVF